MRITEGNKRRRDFMAHRILTVSVLIGLLSASVAFAHDASLHKGKPTVGQVTSLADKGVKLQTDKGPVMVTWQEKTVFERGDAQASPQEIHQGDRLTVFGTKLPSGELVAREVLLPNINTQREPSGHPTARNTQHH
jgi:hypothetical protein